MQPRASTVGSVPHRPFPGQNCSIAGALEVLGERWTLLVMREVLLGRRRFARHPPPPRRRAEHPQRPPRTLVEHGLLERAHGEDPEAAEYVPTRKGADAQPGAGRAVALGRPLRGARAARRASSSTPAAATTPIRGCTARTAARCSSPPRWRSAPDPAPERRAIGRGARRRDRIPRTVQNGPASAGSGRRRTMASSQRQAPRAAWPSSARSR